jgi:hypothetical protein
MTEKDAIMARLSPGQIRLAHILAEAIDARLSAKPSTSDRSHNENSNLRSVQLGQAERNVTH